MNIADILSPGRVVHRLSAVSKKRTLEQAASLIARDIPELDARELFESLVSRERLGSTGLGHGVAIPHARLKQSPQTFGALITLDAPVDFDAIDREPVDIIFVLVVPDKANQEHLDTLATLARGLSDTHVRKAIRQSIDATDLHRVFIHAMTGS